MVVLIMLGILAQWVLLPLVPAILMFRLVPGIARSHRLPIRHSMPATLRRILRCSWRLLFSWWISSQSCPNHLDRDRQDRAQDANGKPERFQRHADKIKVITNPEVYVIDNNTAWI